MALSAMFFAAALAASNHDIGAMLDGYTAAWARADAKDLAAHYASNGALVTPDGVSAHGAAEITAFYSAAFQRGYAGSRAEAHLTEIDPLGGDTALVGGLWSIRGARDGAGAPRAAECGTFFAGIRREHRVWRIVVLHELSGRCEGEKSGAAAE